MSVLDRVRKVVAQTLGVPVSAISQNTDLGDLGADQQTLSDIKHALEEEFDVTISDDEAADFTTVDSIYEVVKSKLKE
jgi:acyl carrier protein